MDGIAYATDASGTVIAYGASKWNEFAAANGGLRLVRPEAVLGRSILDVITGEQVRVAYRHFLAALAENRVGAIRFSYRCDGPGAGRAMQMSITRLRWGGEPAGFLFQSTLLDRGVRAPVTLFESTTGWTLAEDGDETASQFCSFCQKLCRPGRSRDDPANWTYDAPVPTEDRRVAYAVCPSCEDRCNVLAANGAKAPDLSRRQREVLAMLVRGHPNKMICAKLGMSPNTVKTHLRVIFRELQATNRTEAATEALRRWPGCATVDGADPG